MGFLSNPGILCQKLKRISFKLGLVVHKRGLSLVLLRSLHMVVEGLENLVGKVSFDLCV